MTTTKPPAEHVAWYALSADEAARALDVDSGQGLDAGEVTQRLAQYGPNELPTEPPVFPYLGWIILGWILTWAAVELGMLQRLLNTESLTGRQWLVVLGLSLVTPLVVGVDKLIQLRRQRGPSAGPLPAMTGMVNDKGTKRDQPVKAARA